MYRIRNITPNEIDRIYNFRIANHKQGDGHQSLNDSTVSSLQEFPLAYSAGLKLLYAAVLQTDEIIGYIAGHPPAIAINYTSSNIKLPVYNKKALTNFKRRYITLKEMLSEDYFLIASASFKEGIDQKEIFASLLDKLTSEACRQYFPGIVFLAARKGLCRFLPLSEFNLVETMQFTPKEPFLNVYYRSSL